MKRYELIQKQYSADTQEVARIAASIRDLNDCKISWGECIRLAEKYLREG